jgi:hypothetical protein
LVPLDMAAGEDEDKKDTLLMRQMVQKAKAHIESWSWAGPITEEYSAIGIGGIFVVCLFRFVPLRKNLCELMWVVVGDIPPATVRADTCDSAVKALTIYINAMQKWIDAVRNSLPVDDLAPVNVPPTADWADKLQSRISYLRDEILPDFLELEEDGE